jgi:hypothetical protein
MSQLTFAAAVAAAALLSAPAILRAEGAPAPSSPVVLEGWVVAVDPSKEELTFRPGPLPGVEVMETRRVPEGQTVPPADASAKDLVVRWSAGTFFSWLEPAVVAEVRGSAAPGGSTPRKAEPSSLEAGMEVRVEVLGSDDVERFATDVRLSPRDSGAVTPQIATPLR